MYFSFLRRSGEPAGYDTEQRVRLRKATRRGHGQNYGQAEDGGKAVRKKIPAAQDWPPGKWFSGDRRTDRRPLRPPGKMQDGTGVLGAAVRLAAAPARSKHQVPKEQVFEFSERIAWP